MLVFTLLSLACLVSANPDHHGDGHEENCVDISRYSDILYEESTHDVCTYRVASACSKSMSSACVSIPIEKCTVVGYANCQAETFTELLRDDMGETQSFIPKKCHQSGEETLVEYHKTPVCEPVTKEQCDSKWVVNEFGEKVWAGNENCKDVTWEDCKLESIPHPIVVPTYTCQDKAVIQYTKPTFSEIDVTAYTAKCQAAAFADCSTNYVQECVELEYEECTDSFEEVCFGAMTFRIPFQEYDHRLKCIQ